MNDSGFFFFSIEDDLSECFEKGSDLSDDLHNLTRNKIIFNITACLF